MNDITEALTQIAISKSIPFCYGCYTRAPSGLMQTGTLCSRAWHEIAKHTDIMIIIGDCKSKDIRITSGPFNPQRKGQIDERVKDQIT